MLNKVVWLSMICLGITSAPPVYSHGVIANVESVEAVSISASFDTGQPMSEAQVVVYAPNDPQNAYLQGVTDENGNFIFQPDTSITGQWTVRVRGAGHGTIIYVPVEATNTTTENRDETAIATSNNDSVDDSTVSNNLQTQSSTVSPSSSTTVSQKILMAVSGVWGFVGTALFFSRKN